ncbi:MAG: GNAT family N-acetyltransferase [Gammaproteobacteria bacterium]
MTSAIKFELGNRGDAEPIATMSRYLIEAGLEWRWTPARVMQQVLCVDSIVLIARGRVGIIGFAIMHFLAEDAHLLLLAVRPSHQRQGLGRAMVAWLEKSARVAGIARIHLEVRATNPRARAFYRALGFRETQFIPGYYYGREGAVRMMHELRVSA